MRVKWKWLSGSGLKILAVVSMLVDHLAVFVWRNDPWAMTHLFQIGQRWVTPYFLMRSFGRLAFPLFAFLFVEGFIHTRSRKRYGLNLGVFALISEIPYNLVVSGTWHCMGQNVFFTLFFGFLGMCAIEYFKEDIKKMAFALLGLLAVTVVFPSFVTFPPQVAELVVILLTVDVVTVGSVVVVNVRSSPYAVPALFVAYART
jgi:hypothetical protein